jgi:hypothetical protein
MYSALIIGHEQRTGHLLLYTSPVDLNNLNKLQNAAYCFATIITQVGSSHWRVSFLSICGLRLMRK